MADGIFSARCHHLKLPKGRLGQFRRVAIVDPYDQIIYRAIVAGFVALVDQALGPEVRSYRLAAAPPGWQVKGGRYIQTARRKDVIRHLALGSFPDSLLSISRSTIHVPECRPAVKFVTEGGRQPGRSLAG